MIDSIAYWWSKDRSLKLQFIVNGMNKVHVMLGNVCDVAQNYDSAQNDFKVKVLWRVKKCLIELYTNNGQHIKKQFPEVALNSIVEISFYTMFYLVTSGNVCDILVYLFGHVCDIFEINCVLTHAQTEKNHDFCFRNTP